MTDSGTDIHHQTDLGSWSIAAMKPSPPLRDWVVGYSGYRELAPSKPVLRREIPTTVVALIINFGSAFTIRDPRQDAMWVQRSTFIAGLHQRPAFVQADGRAYCLQIDFTPLGACRFFNSGLHHLNHATTPLDEVLESEVNDWADQLRELPTWLDRFKWTDKLLISRFAKAVQPQAEVDIAWQWLKRSGGRIKIGELAQNLNCSREHCSRLIKDELGLPPKTLAKIIRFECAVAMMNSDGHRSLTDISLASGYNDQSHFIADCKALSGITPSQLMAANDVVAGLIENV